MPEEDFVTRMEMETAIKEAIARANELRDAIRTEQVRLIAQLIHTTLVASIGTARAQYVLDAFLAALQENAIESGQRPGDAKSFHRLVASLDVEEAVGALLHPPA